MNQSNEINELATALSKAQAKIRNAEEDKSNPHFKSRYATLSSIWDACRGPLTENGLAVTQTPVLIDGVFQLVTILMHSSGQWVKSSFPIAATVKVQEYGSQLTYLKRYTLSSIVGVSPGDNDDDDGEKAMGRPAVKNDKISEEQYQELISLLKKTPESFRKNFTDLLKKEGINGYREMPEKLYIAQKPIIMAQVIANEEAPF